MSRWPVVIAARALFALVVLVPAIGSANSHTAVVSHDDNPDSGVHSRLSLTLGLLTPTGEFGLEYTVVVPYLEVGVGGGVGLVYGAQASIMPRLHLGNRELSVTLGAGISGGPYGNFAGPCFTTNYDQCKSTKTTALWANVEAGLMWTSDGGASLRLYGGIGTIVGQTGCTGPDNCDGFVGDQLPYLGFAIGHSL
jgi:hypothetical protein